MNFDKLDKLIKETGKSKSYLCSLIGRDRYYIRDCKKTGNVPEDVIYTWAKDLGTSFEYLTDITDDPSPDYFLKITLSTEKRIGAVLEDRLYSLPPEDKATLERLLQLPDEELDRALDMLELLWKNNKS